MTMNEWTGDDVDMKYDSPNMRINRIFREKLREHYPDLYAYLDSDRHFSSILSLGEELGIHQSSWFHEDWNVYCERLWEHIKNNEVLHALWLL